MIAIDTNLIVRYVTGDHEAQSAKARALIEAQKVFVATTVLLETEWVLRGTYDYPATRVLAALRAFLGLPNVTTEAPLRIAQALDWLERGMDFADALHLSAASDCEAFISFDRRFAHVARRLDAMTVRAP